MKFLRNIRDRIKRSFGLTDVQSQQVEMRKLLQDAFCAQKFHDTIVDSEWLTYKSFTPGGWAVDYAFLTTLYKVLNAVQPKQILEFGLGQSSKLIHQYANFYNANALTVEHDKEWYNFFIKSNAINYSINLKFLELDNVDYKSCKTITYKNIQEEFKGFNYDLIVVDAPFGSSRYSRSQIISLVENNLNNIFCIIMDDYERFGEQETVEELKHIFAQKNIQVDIGVYSGTKKHCLLCSHNLKFLTTM